MPVNSDPAADATLQWLMAPRARRPRALAGLVALIGVAILAAAIVAFYRAATPPPARAVLDPRRIPHIDSPFAPAALRPLTPRDAIVWNAAAVPVGGPNPAAAAFVAPLTSANDYRQSLECLTMAVYYEAGNEADAGQRAVAQVVLNRMRHIAYPHTVCGVVFQGAQHRNACQFTFACDGSLRRVPSRAGWQRAGMVAAAALGGYVYAGVGLATHYHADYVVPYWAAQLDKVTTIGAHIFYRWGGTWGRGGAFTARYAGGEKLLALPGGTIGGPATAAALPAVDAPPAEVTAAERPVILPGSGAMPIAGAASRTAKDRQPTNIIDSRERWIVPHAASVGAAGTQPPLARPVIVPHDDDRS